MSDHRASVKIRFERHGVATDGDFWITWWRGASNDGLPSAIIDWFAAAEARSMEAYDDETDKADHQAVERRKQLAQSARAKLTDDEWDAVKGD